MYTCILQHCIRVKIHVCNFAFLVSVSCLSLSIYIYTLYDFYEYQSLWLVLISLLAHLYYYHAIVIKRKRLNIGKYLCNHRFVLSSFERTGTWLYVPLYTCTLTCPAFLWTFSCINLSSRFIFCCEGYLLKPCPGPPVAQNFQLMVTSMETLILIGCWALLPLMAKLPSMVSLTLWCAVVNHSRFYLMM